MTSASPRRRAAAAERVLGSPGPATSRLIRLRAKVHPLLEGHGFPVEPPVFKTGEMRLACLVGSTPTPFRRPHPVPCHFRARP